MLFSLFLVFAPWMLILMGNWSSWHGKQYAYWHAMMEVGGFSFPFWETLIKWDKENKPSFVSRAVLGRWEPPLKRYAQAGNRIPLDEVSDVLIDHYWDSYFPNGATELTSTEK